MISRTDGANRYGWATGEPAIEWCKLYGIDAAKIPMDEFDVKPHPDGPGFIAIYREFVADANGVEKLRSPNSDELMLSPQRMVKVDTTPPRWDT